MSPWLSNLLPIVALLVVVAVVVSRLPKVELGHSPAFLKRRVANWLPVGMTYAFLYMGRYNLNTTTLKEFGPIFDTAQYSAVAGWGTLTYGLSFLLNGPLTDRFGGRLTIMVAAGGSALMNLMMGYLLWSKQQGGAPIDGAELQTVFSLLYAANMYFQSFGAVAIVKVNSSWFHIRERGTFGGIFGILISLGLYFAFDWCAFLARGFGISMAFLVPAGILVAMCVIDFLLVRDTPGQAGHVDFDLGDATDDGPRKSVAQVALQMLKNPAIVTITLIEFCSGYLRNSIMQYYKPFVNALGRTSDFVFNNWGMLMCIAGIMGGVLAGVLSDRLFHSRRGPVAAVLYAVMVVGSGLMFVALDTPFIGWVVLFMTLAIIGVHGMLSGTASMDFGGKKNVGIAVGIIDGFVYLGTTLEHVVLAKVLPKKDVAGDVELWWTWPAAILPVAIIGFLLTLRVWNARPTKAPPSPAPIEPTEDKVQPV